MDGMLIHFISLKYFIEHLLHASDISKGCVYNSKQDRHDLCPRGAYLPLGENDQSNQRSNKQVISDCGKCYEETNKMI